VSTSALVGDPDLYPQVYRLSKLKLRSVWVIRYRWLGSTGQVPVDTHPISLYIENPTNSHFTNSSDISTYQIPYWRQIRTCPNDPIVFLSRLCTGEHTADSAQLRFHSLSLSIWFDMPSGSTPCGFTLFWIISKPVYSIISAHFLRYHLTTTWSTDLGMFWLSKYWCPRIHTPSRMSIMTLWHPSTSIPLWLFSNFLLPLYL